MPVIIASMMPSGTSLPSRSRMAALVMRWPTLRTSISDRRCTSKGVPVGPLYSKSGLSFRMKLEPPFDTSS